MPNAVQTASNKNKVGDDNLSRQLYMEKHNPIDDEIENFVRGKL